MSRGHLVDVELYAIGFVLRAGDVTGATWFQRDAIAQGHMDIVPIHRSPRVDRAGRRAKLLAPNSTK